MTELVEDVRRKDESRDVADSLRDMQLKDITEVKPVREVSIKKDPEERAIEQRTFDIQHEVFTEHYFRCVIERKRDLETGMKKAYTLILQRYCNAAMKRRVEEHPEFESKIRSDPIELLKAIRMIMLGENNSKSLMTSQEERREEPIPRSTVDSLPTESTKHAAMCEQQQQPIELEQEPEKPEERDDSADAGQQDATEDNAVPPNTNNCSQTGNSGILPQWHHTGSTTGKEVKSKTTPEVLKTYSPPESFLAGVDNGRNGTTETGTTETGTTETGITKPTKSESEEDKDSEVYAEVMDKNIEERQAKNPVYNGRPTRKRPKKPARSKKPAYKGVPIQKGWKNPMPTIQEMSSDEDPESPTAAIENIKLTGAIDNGAQVEKDDYDDRVDRYEEGTPMAETENDSVKSANATDKSKIGSPTKSLSSQHTKGTEQHPKVTATATATVCWKKMTHEAHVRMTDVQAHSLKMDPK